MLSHTATAVALSLVGRLRWDLTVIPGSELTKGMDGGISPAPFRRNLCDHGHSIKRAGVAVDGDVVQQRAVLKYGNRIPYGKRQRI